MRERPASESQRTREVSWRITATIYRGRSRTCSDARTGIVRRSHALESDDFVRRCQKTMVTTVPDHARDWAGVPARSPRSLY